MDTRNQRRNASNAEPGGNGGGQEATTRPAWFAELLQEVRNENTEARAEIERRMAENRTADTEARAEMERRLTETLQRLVPTNMQHMNVGAMDATQWDAAAAGSTQSAPEGEGPFPRWNFRRNVQQGNGR